LSGLGEILRKAREQKGLSLEEVEAITRIRRKHLEALESDDFASLPPATYVKGFVKNYATVLGLDPQQMLELLPLSEPKVEIQPPMKLEKPPRGLGIWLFGLLTVCFVGGLAAYLYNYYQNNRPYVPPDYAAIVVPTLTPVPTPEGLIAVATQTVPPKATEGIEVRVRAIDRAWMAVYIDGDARPVYNGTMEIGETQTFSGKERVYIHCGNAGGVDYTINGQRKGLMGKPGEVVRFEWSVTAPGAAPAMRTVAPSEQPFNTPVASATMINPTVTATVVTPVTPKPATTPSPLPTRTPVR
jgi:transcriptional regulator with XRE-family HTH domain